jgi:hypothetical protein
MCSLFLIVFGCLGVIENMKTSATSVIRTGSAPPRSTRSAPSKSTANGQNELLMLQSILRTLVRSFSSPGKSGQAAR